MNKSLNRSIQSDSDSGGQGFGKNIIPSSKTDIYTRFKILLGILIFGHPDTFTEATNLLDDLN